MSARTQHVVSLRVHFGSSSPTTRRQTSLSFFLFPKTCSSVVFPSHVVSLMQRLLLLRGKRKGLWGRRRCGRRIRRQAHKTGIKRLGEAGDVFAGVKEGRKMMPDARQQLPAVAPLTRITRKTLRLRIGVSAPSLLLCNAVCMFMSVCVWKTSDILRGKERGCVSERMGSQRSGSKRRRKRRREREMVLWQPLMTSRKRAFHSRFQFSLTHHILLPIL